MSKYDLKHQRDRKTPHKPSVVKNHLWWAQVIDLNGDLVTQCFFNQQDALAEAYRYASIVEWQQPAEVTA